MKKPTLVGIGEILWDLLPAGKQLGGAPANFAYHAHALGAHGIPVSAIGADLLGVEIRERLNDLGLDGQHLTLDRAHPTGTVKVELSTDGKPTFTIMPEVAWDYIPDTPALHALAAKADVICFGSLAQRAPGSQAAIRAFLRSSRPEALRVFDINLRQHFHTREVIEASLELATVLKINDEELPVLAALFGLKGDEEMQLAELARRYQLQLVALTCGARGSVLYAGGRVAYQAAATVQVVDSIGAGDAFTAALAIGLLRGHALDRLNADASRLAAYVCTQPGATPPLPAELVQALA